MKGIKNNLIKTGFMTDEQKMIIAWQDMREAISKHDLNKVFKMAFWIKDLLKKFEQELPVIK